MVYVLVEVNVCLSCVNESRGGFRLPVSVLVGLCHTVLLFVPVVVVLGATCVLFACQNVPGAQATGEHIDGQG